MKTYISFSTIKILFFFCLFITSQACSRNVNPSETKPTSSNIITYLALGDSYTIGESVAIGDRWPVQLVNALNQKGIIIANPDITATTGWTTDELSTAMDSAELQTNYDLVSLLIGVNNQYRGRDVENFRVEYKALLERAIEHAGGEKNRVFVVSIPDWGVMPFAKDRDQAEIAKKIDLYNKVKREETKKMGVPFFDITPISREAKTGLELVASDGLHPSGTMYERWVQEVLVEKVAEMVR